MKKTLVVGLGKSGIAAYDLLEREGDEVVGFDDNLAAVQRLNDAGKTATTSPAVREFDRLVVSPGVPPTHPVIAEATQLGLPLIGEAELALQRMQMTAVGITGTNGKTTVTLLIEHVLKTAGLSAHALGNVGEPLSAYVKHAKLDDIAVVELSSFQLDTLSVPFFDIGLILNITPDHLDRYESMQQYAESKCRLQNCLKPTGELWIHESIAKDFKELIKVKYYTYGQNPDCTLSINDVAFLRNSPSIPNSGEKKRIRQGSALNLSQAKPALKQLNLTKLSDGGGSQRQELADAAETLLFNRVRYSLHDRENSLAAWIACRKLGVTEVVFQQALQSFKKPSHRIEWVASFEGVDYVNDSKGTNIDATIKAAEAMSRPTLLIAGGVDKGASYEIWKKSFANKVRHVVAIGQAAEKIAKDLEPDYQVQILPSLRDAVLYCTSVAREGDVVLLSPGCSSYDMFRDYAHRGDEFKRIVYLLQEKKG